MDNTLATVIITAALAINNHPEKPIGSNQELKVTNTPIITSKKALKRLNQKINNKVNGKKYNRLKGSKDTK